MKKDEFIPINEMLKRLRKIDKVYTFFDKLTFLHIFLIWTGIILTFGIIYSLFSSQGSFLLYTPTKTNVTSILDGIYFSFITATSTGFGDIVPNGIFKAIAIFEVVFGLVLLAFVTSKLVSIKQNAILNEVYEISFNERLSRLRSSLLVFRQGLSRLMEKIEEGTIKKREISDLYVNFSSLDSILNEIITFFGSGGDSRFTKAIDNLNTELIFNSVISSFEKINELIIALNDAKINWKRDITINLINSCINVNNMLFEKLHFVKKRGISEKTIADLNEQNKKIIESIKNGLKAEVEIFQSTTTLNQQ
jgi:potassium channel LctB